MPAQHETEPYQRVAWSILNDCFSTKICIRNRPDQLALAACYLALESCDIKVYMQEHAEKPWWKVMDFLFNFVAYTILNLKDDSPIFGSPGFLLGRGGEFLL